MKSKLIVHNIYASIEGKEILHGVNLTINGGEIHAIMGPNGSGKSTLASVLMGHSDYIVNTKEKSGDDNYAIMVDTKHIESYSTEERARSGLYLAFQQPIAIPGVSIINLLRTAYQEIHGEKNPDDSHGENPLLVRRFRGGGITLSDFMKRVKEFADKLAMPESFLTRGIHEGFSGGEKKKIEMLQALVLKPKFAIFDEIDTGLDVDALKIVAYGISLLQKQGTGVLIITHYQRILEYIHPDVVHIFYNGKIIETGGPKLAKRIEKKGYASYREKK